MKNLKRDKRVLELSKKGKSSGEIKDIINKEFDGKNLAYYEIDKIKSRLNKKIKDV